MKFRFPDWYEATAASWAVIRARKFAEQLEADAGSPIEILLGSSLLLSAFETGFPLQLNGESETGFVLRQQVNIDRYRVDFLIEGRGKSLIIECDGRDFHHSTREQIERDRLRDAVLTSLGHTVHRYPGTQIDNDLWKVVMEICGWLDGDAAMAWFRENQRHL